MTKPDDALLGDVLAYAGAAAVCQWVSHLVLASDPKLPTTWEQLVARYVAGSGIVAAATTAYTLRHPEAGGRAVVALHWGVLLGCGAAVAVLHLADALRERAEARAQDEVYDRENGHVASPPPRPPLPLPLGRRA